MDFALRETLTTEVQLTQLPATCWPLPTSGVTQIRPCRVTSKPAMSEARDDQMLAEFRTFMEADRGLSPATVKGCCSSVRPFLIQLLDRRRSLEKIIVSDVGSLLAEKVNEEHYARRSVRDYASSLRSFFRYAEMRGWCAVGIATSIMAPRVFQQEALPSGPTWMLCKKSKPSTGAT